jgi:DamX protein
MKEKAAFALEDTLAVYGIRNNPFPIDATDDFFFSTPMLTKQMEALRNLVEYGDLLLVVSGVEGAGKTTFLEQFLLAVDERWKCCHVNARAAVTLDTLVVELIDGFGLSARGDDAQADEALLRAHLAQVHASGDIALAVVDDAHLLPQICTEFLLGLAQQRDGINLRLLLAAEPGRLGFPTDDPARVHVVVLQPFDIQQTGDYLHTRLSHGGLDGDSPFDATVVEGIYHDSGGLPGTIHSLALHTLLANSDTTRTRGRGVPMSRTLATALVVLAIVIGVAALLFFDTDVEPVATVDPGATGAVRGRITGLSVEPGVANSGTAGSAALEAPASQAEPFSGNVTAETQAETQANTLAKTLASTGPTVIALQTGKEAKVFTLDDNRVPTRQVVAVESPAAIKDGAPSTMTPELALASNATPALGASPASPGRHGLDWLRQQDRSHYVIQLVGTRDLTAAGKFLDDNKLGAEGSWFATSYQGKPWYVVVYGIYPDNASARAAIKSLPERLRSGSPWPRSVASLVDSTH